MVKKKTIKDLTPPKGGAVKGGAKVGAIYTK